MRYSVRFLLPILSVTLLSLNGCFGVNLGQVYKEVQTKNIKAQKGDQYVFPIQASPNSVISIFEEMLSDTTLYSDLERNGNEFFVSEAHPPCSPLIYNDPDVRLKLEDCQKTSFKVSVTPQDSGSIVTFALFKFKGWNKAAGHSYTLNRAKTNFYYKFREELKRRGIEVGEQIQGKNF